MVAWYYAKDGERRGPMPWDELRAAARAGAFGPGDLVWTPGYGAEWRKASALETLFPPPKPAPDAPPGPGERDAPAAGGAAAPAAGDPLPAGPSVRVVLRDRSPFEPETPDHRAPDPRPSCLFSLRTALANTRVVLLRPFSLGRWLAFSVAVLLMLLGAQSEWSLVPAASPTLRATAESAGLGAVLESRLFTLPERWSGAFRRGLVQADYAPLADDLGESLRDASARAVAWARGARARDRLAVFGGAALLLLVFCAMRAWFLARSWTLFVERVYRRDEPMLLSWLDARVPSRAIFRGVLAWRLALLALHAAAFGWAIVSLSRLPEGGAGADALASAALLVAAPLLADALAMGFLRDFAVPRVVLLRRTFGAAVREALAALGAWYLRYLLLLGALALAVWLVLGQALALVLGAALAGLPSLMLVAFAALATPWQLLRCLWSLDLFFRLCPQARALVPPRAFAAPRRSPAAPGGRAP